MLSIAYADNPPSVLYNAGVRQGVYYNMNCSTGMSCSLSGVTATVTSTGGGGGVTSVRSNAGNNDPVVSPTSGAVVISASQGSNNNLFMNIMNNQGGIQ